MNKKRKKWQKVRSGRRILGMIQHVSGDVYLWKATAKHCGKDQGISETKERAVNNILRDCGMSSRQYEVSVED